MQRFSLDLVFYRTYADLKAETQRTYLGILWWIIEPITSMAIYYFIFSTVLQRGTEDFVPFLLIGIVMWQWFAASVNNGAKAILQSRGLVNQIPVSKLTYPLVFFLANSAKFCISLTLLLVFLNVYGLHANVHYAALPVVLAIQIVVILGIMLPLSAVTPFLPDISNILSHVIRLMFYLSGVLYPPERIPDAYRWLLDYNPMALVIRAYRDVLMYNQWPAMWMHLLGAATAGLALAAFGVMLIRRFDGYYAKRMDR